MSLERTAANRRLWIATYTANLTAAHTRKPEGFAFPASDIGMAVEFMTATLAAGKAKINTDAIRATCVALGIAQRQATIAAFLNGEG